MQSLLVIIILLAQQVSALSMPLAARVEETPKFTSVSLSGERLPNGTLRIDQLKKTHYDATGVAVIPMEEASKLQTRQMIPGPLVVAEILATELLSAAVIAAIVVGIFFIVERGWDAQREAFTYKTTEDMMLRLDGNLTQQAEMPEAVAAICVNNAYDLKIPENQYGRTSVGTKRALYHTDYDCMYLKAPNDFWGRGDGGYINLAFNYKTDRCIFDDATSDLYCN